MWMLTALWGPRAESATESAQRLLTWLDGVSAIHPALAEWRLTADTAAEAQAGPVVRGLDEWAALFQEGVVAPEFGAVVSAWSGAVDEGNQLLVCCGGTGPLSQNLLRLTMADSIAPDLLAPDTATALLAATATAWAPGTAQISSIELAPDREPGPDGFLPGWLMYFPAGSPHLTRAREVAEHRATVTGLGEIFALAPTHAELDLGKVEAW